MANSHSISIIGSGPAGLTAAIYAARANLNPTVFMGTLPFGQLSTTTHVENFPGFPKGIMGPELMENMLAQAKEFGTTIVYDTIRDIKPLDKAQFELVGGSESAPKQYKSDGVIIATGASPRRINCPGEIELTGYGVSTCATCDGAFFKEKIICVVGGGDSAMEEANFLTRFGSKVYLIHRRDEFRASKIMLERVINNPKIEILRSKTVIEVIGSRKDGVKSLKIQCTKSGDTSDLTTDALFVAIGHIPNTDFFRNLVDLDDDGYAVTKSGTQTKTPGIFVCGDVKDRIYRQAITAAGSGCMAALEMERYLESV